MREVKKMKPRRKLENAEHKLAVSAMVTIISVALVLGIVFFATGGKGRGGSSRITAQEQGTTPSSGTTPASTATVEDVKPPALSVYGRRNPFRPRVDMDSSMDVVGKNMLEVWDAIMVSIRAAYPNLLLFEYTYDENSKTYVKAVADQSKSSEETETTSEGAAGSAPATISQDEIDSGKYTKVAVALPSVKERIVNAPQPVDQAGEQGVVSVVITLEAVFAVDGKTYVRIRVGDQLFEKVTEGEVFGSYYKLATINNRQSVTIIYGDEKFSLNAGQSIYW